MESLEQRIQKIEDRNEKVETDKAWEISWMRRIILAVFTYLIVGLFLWTIKVSRPWINAVVPSLGFIISTLVMPFFKKIWLRRARFKKQ